MAEQQMIPSRTLLTHLTQVAEQIWYSLPEGGSLQADVWQRRHVGLVVLLWLHVAGLAGFGILAGYSMIHILVEVGMIAVVGFFAQLESLSARLRSALVSMGLITSSAVLVHFSGGYVEMHFHFFVMVVVISLYQDWIPFLMTLAYVVLHHGILGVLVPTSVYNHPDAWAHPWKWALIHAGFVLAISAASLLNWRLTEAMQSQGTLVLNAAADGICGVDREGRITFFNTAAAKMLGSHAGEVMGRPLRELLPDESAAAVELALRGCGTHDRNDTILVRSDKTTLPVEYICEPIRKRGQVLGAVLTFQDMTERKRMETERKRIEDERIAHLEERKQAQEQLIHLQEAELANLSTPLIPITDRVILMPLIGVMDVKRGHKMIETLLSGIEHHRAQVAILDLTGASFADTLAGETFLKVAQMGRLLGAEVVLTGIRPEVSQALIGLGIDLRQIITHSTLQNGVHYALQRRTL